MALNYNTAVKNARLTAVVTAIGASGKLVIGETGMATVLAEVPFSNPAFNVSGGAMSTNNPPRTTVAVATGTADEVEIRDGANVVIADGLTIGLPGSGADVIVNALEISTGQTVQITVGNITHG